MRKGFTLIELLAVIVILAIIALIATPIVLNIINDTKESATLRSADFYIDALENEIMLENMKLGGSFNPNVCSVNGEKVSCDGKELTIKVDGEVPTSGSITFEEGKVLDVNLTFGSNTITKDSNGQLVLGESKEKESICTLVNDADSSGSITVGDKYQCKVKDNMETGFEDGYYFYVLGTNEDGSINLIMDTNICEDGSITTEDNVCLVEWINLTDYKNSGGTNNYEPTNEYGPLTLLTKLQTATLSWKNVSKIEVSAWDNYSGNEYMLNKTFEMRAQLPKLNQLLPLKEDTGTLQSWLYEGGSFWLSTATSYEGGAYGINNEGYITQYGPSDDGTNVILEKVFGMRPVITVKL